MVGHLLTVLLGCLNMMLGMFIWIEVVGKGAVLGLARYVINIFCYFLISIGALLIIYSIGSIILLIQLAERGL